MLKNLNNIKNAIKTSPISSKLNICIVNSYIYSLYNKKTKFNFGGSEVQLYLLSKEFIKNKNIRVNVITGDLNLKRIRIEYYKKIKIFVGLLLELKRISQYKSNFILFLLLCRINPDFVIQRGGGIETAICAIFCKLFKKKFIFSIATDCDVINGGKIGYINNIYKIGLKYADFIIAQKEKQIKLLEAWKNKSINNIKLIKSGFEIKNYNKTEKKYILWVGRAIDWKQPELYLKLAYFFPSEQFIMICRKSFSFKYWEKIKEEAKKIPNLNFIEIIHFKNINEYFRKAKLFINTSKIENEGFPNTFIQALINKTPIITLIEDPDDFLVLNKCGFNCEGNFNKMKCYLRDLLENKELYNKFANNSYNFVKQKHDIKKISNEWIKVIESIYYK